MMRRPPSSRPRLVGTLLVVGVLATVGCLSPYESRYRGLRYAPSPRPVAAAQVKVIAANDHLPETSIMLGRYWGGAPTLREAMAAAQRSCGYAGADYFAVRIEPHEVGGIWKVEGSCLARAHEQPATTSPRSPRPRDGRAP